MWQICLAKLPVSMVRKDATLYFRQVIPVDVRPYFKQTSIKKSLKTGNITIAKRKTASMSTLMWDIFTAIRQGDSRLTQLSDTQLRQLVDKWLMEILEADEIERRNGLSDRLHNFWRIEKDDEGNIVDKGYSQTVIEEVDKALETNDYQQTYYNDDTGESGGVWQLKKFANEFIKAERLDVIEPSPQHAALMREMAKAYKIFLQAGQLRTLGDYTAADELIARWLHHMPQNKSPIINAATEEDELAEGTIIKLGDFIREYKAKRLSKISVKEAVGIENELQLFMGFVGDCYLHKIPVSKAREFRDKMAHVPVGWTKSPKYKKMPFETLGKLNLPPEELIAPDTRYHRLGRIRTALSWAIKEGYRVNRDLPMIVCGEKPESVLSAEQKRDPFSKDDIVKMFQHEGYTKDSFEYASRFWIPLLGLYTGARLNEICQLNPQTDIAQTETGIWYIDINRADGKSTKTKASIRSVPIHKLLMDIGFLNYVERQKETGETLLFPELRNNRKDEKQYNKFSRWFNDTFKKEIGITSLRRKQSADEEKKDFHSFRHHAARYCKLAGLEKTKYQECFGHETDSSVTATYEGRYPPEILYDDVIVKLNFDTDYGLNLSRLKESKYARR